MLQINDNTIATATRVIKQHLTWSKDKLATREYLYQLVCFRCYAYIPAKGEYGYDGIVMCAGGCGATFCSQYCSELFAEDSGKAHAVDCSVIRNVDGAMCNGAQCTCEMTKSGNAAANCVYHNNAMEIVKLYGHKVEADDCQTVMDGVLLENWILLLTKHDPRNDASVAATLISISVPLSSVWLHTLSNDLLLTALYFANRANARDCFGSALAKLAKNHFTTGNLNLAKNMLRRALRCDEFNSDALLTTLYCSLECPEEGIDLDVYRRAATTPFAISDQTLNFDIWRLCYAIQNNDIHDIHSTFESIGNFIDSEVPLSYSVQRELFLALESLKIGIETLRILLDVNGVATDALKDFFISIGNDLLDKIPVSEFTSLVLRAEYFYYRAHFYYYSNADFNTIVDCCIESAAHFKAQFGENRRPYIRRIASLEEILSKLSYRQSNH